MMCVNQGFWCRIAPPPPPPKVPSNDVFASASRSACVGAHCWMGMQRVLPMGGLRQQVPPSPCPHPPTPGDKAGNGEGGAAESPQVVQVRGPSVGEGAEVHRQRPMLRRCEAHRAPACETCAGPLRGMRHGCSRRPLGHRVGDAPQRGSG